MRKYIFLALLAVSCTTSQNTTIVGKWMTGGPDGEKIVAEFGKNGEFTMKKGEMLLMGNNEMEDVHYVFDNTKNPAHIDLIKKVKDTAMISRMEKRGIKNGELQFLGLVVFRGDSVEIGLRPRVRPTHMDSIPRQDRMVFGRVK